MSNIDHLVIDHRPGLPYAMWCQHCDTRETFYAPITIDILVAASAKFTKQHRHCERGPSTPRSDAGQDP